MNAEKMENAKKLDITKLDVTNLDDTNLDDTNLDASEIFCLFCSRVETQYDFASNTIKPARLHPDCVAIVCSRCTNTLRNYDLEQLMQLRAKYLKRGMDKSVEYIERLMERM